MIEYYCKVNEAPRQITSREILSLKRREDGTFEFYEDGKLAEEWAVDDYDEVWGWMVVKLLRHLKNIGEKRLGGIEVDMR